MRTKSFIPLTEEEMPFEVASLVNNFMAHFSDSFETIYEQGTEKCYRLSKRDLSAFEDCMQKVRSNYEENQYRLLVYHYHQRHRLYRCVVDGNSDVCMDKSKARFKIFMNKFNREQATLLKKA